MKLLRNTLEIGLEKPLKILHVTDTLPQFVTGGGYEGCAREITII